jgi:hypothetical protein
MSSRGTFCALINLPKSTLVWTDATLKLIKVNILRVAGQYTKTIIMDKALIAQVISGCFPLSPWLAGDNTDRKDPLK